MDTDLFQILTLILLLGLLLTLFGVLQSLGSIRKALEGRGRADATAAPAVAETAGPAVQREPQPEAGEQPATWTRPTDTLEPAAAAPEPGPARTGWPAPQEAAAAPEPAVATDEPAEAPVGSAASSGARVLYGDTGLTTSTPSEGALTPAEPEPEPEPEPETASPAAGDEDPQEQPFERDGRWWFRRGEELLVYEEQTGQWVAAAEPGPSSTGSVAAAAAPAGETPEAAAAPAEGQVTTQHEAVGSFWKCPSCGAVNGSTATSCRMCFTARP